MDKISIKNLEVFARHGVLPQENELGQKFIVTAELYANLRAAGKSDDLTQTVDYGAVCRTITGFLTAETYKLIETAAERLAERILLDYPHVKSVKLEIKKPWAPVAAHLETVSVEILRAWHTAYIALGSNMGDRERFLRTAVSELDACDHSRVISVSDFLNTAPYGYEQQDDFLNGCLELETLLTPHELLAFLHDIENKAGRERKIRWGPRTLDLDIIFYDNLIMSDKDLQIPHPEAHKRLFVLTPLCEIAPYLLHPVYDKTVSELKTELELAD